MIFLVYVLYVDGSNKWVIKRRFMHQEVAQYKSSYFVLYFVWSVTREFGLKVFLNTWFGRFVRKEKISADVLWEAVERVENGLIDADLGCGVIKQRIARAGGGKSKGYRSIIIFRQGERCFFVYGFAKSERGNIYVNEAVQFKKMAAYLLSLTDMQLSVLLANGQFEEVKKYD